MDAAVKSSEARLEFSTIKLARSEKLFEKNFISAADLQEAQTEKELAETGLLNALENRRVAGEDSSARTPRSPTNNSQSH